MIQLIDGDAYKVLAADDVIYGPVDLATLAQWVQEGRVVRTTWVYLASANDWHTASELEQLVPLLDAASAPAEAHRPDARPGAVSVGELRQFERLSHYSNDDLERLLRYCDVIQAHPGEVIIRKGDQSDALFLLLSGEVRARLLVGRTETPLGVMHPGEVFGEVAMLSQMPRSADVVAQGEARLVRLTAAHFKQLMEEEKDLATRVLFNMLRTMAKRLAERNKDLARDIASSFVWR